MSAIRRVLDRLTGVKEKKGGWSARCPAHDDGTASLSVAEGAAGRVLVTCHAGCDHKKIVAALGVEERDLFDADATLTPATKKSSSSKPAAKAGKIYASDDEALKAYERTLGRLHTTRPPGRRWCYDTADEQHVGSVYRWNNDDGTKRAIRPTSRHADGWRMEHMPEPRPLFNLPHLVRESGRVYVCEGEKAAESIHGKSCSREGGLGLLATTSSGGSNAASKSDWSPLAGRDVVILPDADDAGRKYADEVAAILLGLDPPATVRVVELDGLEPGGDVADLYEACRSDEELQALREKIERLAGGAEPLTPEAAAPATPKERTAASSVEAYRPFPVDALPEPLSSFVAETAAAIVCDPAYVALPLLTATGAAIGTTRRLALKYDHSVPAIVWTVVVGESGTRKSAPLRSVLQYAKLRERALREEHAAEQRQYNAALAVYEKQQAAWRGDRKGAAEPPEKPAEPVSRRLIVNETTVEALALKLSHNRRGLLLARDELNGWFGGLDRYAKHGGGGDESFYLSCYNAEDHAVDRRTGDKQEIYVPQCGLWLTGTIQPSILRRALGVQRRESGLLARLLLTAPPSQPPKWSENEVSPLTRQCLHDVLCKLYDLQPEVDQEGWYESHLVKLSPAAKAAYVAWHDRHGEELGSLVGDQRAAWSKLLETAARLALIVHEVRVATGKAVASELDAASMAAGIELCEWLKHETTRVYAILDETDDDRLARHADDRLAAWVAKQGGTVAPREVIAGCRRWLATSEEVEVALRRLVDAGRGHWVDKPAGERGGRPSRLFVLDQPAEAEPRKAKPPSAQPCREAVKEGCSSADTHHAAEKEYVEI
jgi:hypothetical protein